MKEGNKPPGPDNPQARARWVRGMFTRVAPRYDLLNHLLSFNLDRYWRARVARRVASVLARSGARALDLCCGTGDLLAALRRRALAAGTQPLLIGCDYCHSMLVAARKKLPDAVLLEADALALPLPDASVDLITVAFGLRNLSDFRAGLREMQRLLRPGGVAAILEFSRPRSTALRMLYRVYSEHILPRIGGWISGVPEAYRYLPESVARFPEPDQLAALMREAGFTQVELATMSGGIVALHIGVAQRAHGRGACRAPRPAN